MNNLTNLFISNLYDKCALDFASSSFDKAKSCLLDYLGCSLGGAHFYSDRLKVFFDSYPESGTCGLIGHYDKKFSMSIAAMLNGIIAHAMELDDGHRIGMLHLGAPVISSLLSVVNKEKISSKDLLIGIIIGYEVAIRLACAVQPDCKLKGYHATGTCGTVGAAMGIAAALHFDIEQMKSAMSAAITSAAGVLEMIDGDTEMKPFNAGRAAMDAVTAAYIGKARFKAPEDALGGKRGFLKIMSEKPSLEYLTNFSQDPMMIDTIYMKPYAACRHCHPSIEAALLIRKHKDFNINDLNSIKVDTYKLAVSGHDHSDIKGINSAKMSIPYSLAVALCTGRAGIEEFTNTYINNPLILSIANKVRVSDVEELTALCPQKRVAIVTIDTKSGVYTERIDYPKGEPENPLRPEELEEKFRGLAIYGGLTEEECNIIINEFRKDVFDLNEMLKIVFK